MFALSHWIFFIGALLSVFLCGLDAGAELTQAQPTLRLGEPCHYTPEGCKTAPEETPLRHSGSLNLGLDGSRTLSYQDPCYFTSPYHNSALCQAGTVSRTLTFNSLSEIPDDLIQHLPGEGDANFKRGRLAATLLDPSMDGTWDVTLACDNDGPVCGLIFSVAQIAGMSMEDAIKYGNSNDFGKSFTVKVEFGKGDSKKNVYRSILFMTEAFTEYAGYRMVYVKGEGRQYQVKQRYRNHNLIGYFETRKRQGVTIRWGTGLQQVDAANGTNVLSATGLQEAYHQLGNSLGHNILPRQQIADGYGTRTGVFVRGEVTKATPLASKTRLAYDYTTGQTTQFRSHHTAIQLRARVHASGGNLTGGKSLTRLSHGEVDTSWETTLQRAIDSPAYRLSAGVRLRRYFTRQHSGISEAGVHAKVERASVHRNGNGKVVSLGMECPIRQSATTFKYEDDECYWHFGVKLNRK